MNILKKLALVLLGLVLLVVLIGFLLPREWSIDRSILIQAPPAKIHAWVESPAKWNEWFAWDEMKSDPLYKVWTSGPERGVGATYEWSGSPSGAGTGKIVIVGCDPATGVHLDEWINSPEKNARGSIVYTTAEGGATRVTWTDTGTLPPVIGGYLLGMVETAVGAAFEKGLANLKAKVER